MTPFTEVHCDNYGRCSETNITGVIDNENFASRNQEQPMTIPATPAKTEKPKLPVRHIWVSNQLTEDNASATSYAWVDRAEAEDVGNSAAEMSTPSSLPTSPTSGGG